MQAATTLSETEISQKETELLKLLEEHNSSLIEKYIDDQKRGVGELRKKKIRDTLRKLGRVHLKKRFDDVTKEDLEEFIEALKAGDLEEEYEESTKTTYLKILKPFFSYLHPEDKEFASWIRTGNFQPTVGPEDILTPGERSLMRAKCVTPRDETMFQDLYESVARPKEFLALRKSDVMFEDDAASLHIRKGKGGQPRDITLLQDGYPLLRNWTFNEHPLRAEEDFPLWVDMSRNSNHEPLQQLGLRKFLQRIAKSAEIKKRVTPYTLRHTRLTDLAREGANDALLCLIAGWKPGSKMPAVYIHLSKRDQKPALKKLLGIATKGADDEEEHRKLQQQPIVCQNCKTTNTSGSRVCVSCRMALDTKTAVEMMKEKEDHNRKIEAKLLEVQESQRKDHETMERVLELLEKAQSSKERRPPSGVG